MTWRPLPSLYKQFIFSSLSFSLSSEEMQKRWMMTTLLRAGCCTYANDLSHNEIMLILDCNIAIVINGQFNRKEKGGSVWLGWVKVRKFFDKNYKIFSF